MARVGGQGIEEGKNGELQLYYNNKKNKKKYAYIFESPSWELTKSVAHGRCHS